MRPKVFAFFSGAGFLDLGFEAAGFEVVFANELRPSFLAGHQFARKQMGLGEPQFGYSGNSIVDFLESPILRQHLGEMVNSAKQSGEFVGFIGGPPCPDFSVGGKNKGKEGENGKLSATYIDLICAQKPDFFLFENVKGLWRTKQHRAFYEELKLKLRKVGYALSEMLINSLRFGVPQERERIILVGVRAKPDNEPILDAMVLEFPWWRYAPYTAQDIAKVPWPSATPFAPAELIRPSKVPLRLTVGHWFAKNDVENHPNGRHCFQPRAGLSRFETVDEGDDSRKSFKRLHRWRYSPTACYGNNEVHLHPYKPRRISVAEALAIQSLPKEFSLPPSMTLSDMFKTVGNGVPYLAAKGLASGFIDFLKEYDDKINSVRHPKGNRSTTKGSRIQLFKPQDYDEDLDRQSNAPGRPNSYQAL